MIYTSIGLVKILKRLDSSEITCYETSKTNPTKVNGNGNFQKSAIKYIKYIKYKYIKYIKYKCN